MIKKLKFSMKMIRYSYGLLTNCVFAAFFAILGAVYMVLNMESLRHGHFSFSSYVGGMLVCMTGAFLVQAWMSFNSAGIVLASPRCKDSLCNIPTLLLSTSYVFGFSVCLAIHLILYRLYPSEAFNLSISIYITTFCNTFILLGFTFMYRYFILSLILYCTVFPWFIMLGSGVIYYLSNRCADSVFFTLPATAAVCYAVLFISLLAAFGLALCLYKKPISKWAQGAALRRYL